MNSGRGGQSPKKNVEDLGLALAPKMCPGQSQTVKEVNNRYQVGIYGRKKNKTKQLFSGPAASRCSKACLYKVLRKKSKNWLRRTNTKSNLTPKTENILKPSNYDAKPWFFTLNRTKVQMSLPFLRVRSCNFANVVNVPLPSLLRMFFLFVFVFFRRKCRVS